MDISAHSPFSRRAPRQPQDYLPLFGRQPRSRTEKHSGLNRVAMPIRVAAVGPPSRSRTYHPEFRRLRSASGSRGIVGAPVWNRATFPSLQGSASSG